VTALGQERGELIATLFALQQAFEALIVRGLESTGLDDTRRLAALGDELARAGAAYLAAQVAALVHAVRERAGAAARALLRAQTAMRVLERVLSLDAAADALAAAPPVATGAQGATRDAADTPAAAPRGGDGARAASGASHATPTDIAEEPVRAAPPSVAVPAAGARGARTSVRAGASVTTPPPNPAPLLVDAALAPVLEELAGFVEGLVGSGLTAATQATQQKLEASFREVSRLKLLRLAAVLRYVGDECGRFLADSPQFSPRRLAFFLNRTWLLCRGLIRALLPADPAALARLLLQASPRPVAALSVVVIGVQKRALLDGAAAFEFRMQVLSGAGVPRGTRLVWSCVFGARKSVPAEAFLHLPQPQKFAPKILLEPTQISVTDAAVTLDDRGGGRLQLGPRSTVRPGPAFDDWAVLQAWDPAGALGRVRGHAISPLDLEVELQEDVVVTDYAVGPTTDHPFRSEQQVVAIRAGALELDAVISRGPDGRELAAALDELRAPGAERPPLYGVLHYEMARLVFQPLTAFGDAGPRHLMISSAHIDLASLMKTLDFTT